MTGKRQHPSSIFDAGSCLLLFVALRGTILSTGRCELYGGVHSVLLLTNEGIVTSDVARH